MSHIKIKSKKVFYNPNPVATDSHGNKTYFCYLEDSSCQKQIEKIFKDGLLPKTAEIKGREDLNFKLSVYQDDGYWFQSSLKEGKVWRLWVPFKDKVHLEKLAEIAKKNA